MNKIDLIEQTLRVADGWEKKGQPAWTIKSLNGALMGYLSLAAEKFSTDDEAVIWLQSKSVDAVMHWEKRTLEVLASQVDLKKLPSSVIGGNYSSLVHAHLAWAMGDISLGDFFVGFSNRADVKGASTDFWKEYSRAMESLASSSPYRRQPLQLHGLEVYWEKYLTLIESMSDLRKMDALVREIEVSFLERNSDTLIVDDGYEIEGSAAHPIKWDFRKAGLLRYYSWRLKH